MSVQDAQTHVRALRLKIADADVEEVVDAIRDCLQRGQLSYGARVTAFEREFAAYTRSKHALATSSGTAALTNAVRALGANGDVLVPANAFYSTAAAPLIAGAQIRLVDVDPRTLAPTVATFAATATDRTVGAMVVHMGGYITPAIHDLATWCAERGIWLLEDAAHAHGSRYGGVHAGRFGTAGAFSFFATKVITTGEGGMMVTDNDELAERFRLFRHLGKPEPWRSHHVVMGDNVMMSELAAALGRSQLRRLDEYLDVRARLAERYVEALTGFEGVRPLVPAHRASWYKFVILLDPGIDRVALRAAMLDAGVELSGEIYEAPLHRQPALEPFIEQPASFPFAEHVCAHHACLPLYTAMTESDVATVVDALATALEKARG